MQSIKLDFKIKRVNPAEYKDDVDFFDMLLFEAGRFRRKPMFLRHLADKPFYYTMNESGDDRVIINSVYILEMEVKRQIVYKYTLDNPVISMDNVPLKISISTYPEFNASTLFIMGRRHENKAVGVFLNASDALLYLLYVRQLINNLNNPLTNRALRLDVSQEIKQYI